MKTKEIVSKLDKNIRHKAGATSNDFIKAYCPMLREHAYATQDDSLNEMEKTLTHSIGILIYYKKFAEILGLPADWDVRDFVDAYESNLDSAAKNRNADISAHLAKLLSLAAEQQP